MLELQKRDAELLDMLLKVQALSPGDQKFNKNKRGEVTVG